LPNLTSRPSHFHDLRLRRARRRGFAIQIPAFFPSGRRADSLSLKGWGRSRRRSDASALAFSARSAYGAWSEPITSPTSRAVRRHVAFMHRLGHEPISSTPTPRQQGLGSGRGAASCTTGWLGSGLPRHPSRGECAWFVRPTVPTGFFVFDDSPVCAS